MFKQFFLDLNHMDVKIIEPIKHFIKEFNTPEEFNMWYKMNKKEMDELTTHKLNKLYHINGYRITKRKGELMLKIYDENKKIENSSNEENLQNEDAKRLSHSDEDRITEIENNIEQINEEIKNIKIALQSVRDYLTNN